MQSPDALRRENAALRDGISSPSAAVLRVSASLDENTVLREIVGSARAPTGARYGAIVTIDEAGRPQDFVIFDGRTGDLLSINREARRIARVLHQPDQTVEDVREVLTTRRADGREISPKSRWHSTCAPARPCAPRKSCCRSRTAGA